MVNDSGVVFDKINWLLVFDPCIINSELVDEAKLKNLYVGFVPILLKLVHIISYIFSPTHSSWFVEPAVYISYQASTPELV